jgi:hypothetical protein
MIIHLFIYQHTYMAHKIYKCIYENETTLSQMRKYLMSRAYGTNKSDQDMDFRHLFQIPLFQLPIYTRHLYSIISNQYLM